MREQLRVWAERLETFFLEVIFGDRHDYKARVTRSILFGGSKIFEVAVKIRRWLYNFRILRDKTLGVQVIAIGNLTVGGTGKTPVVEKFARELRDAGREIQETVAVDVPHLRALAVRHDERILARIRGRDHEGIARQELARLGSG